MANWSRVIDRPRTMETSTSPPATIATSATTTPSRIDGNGWTSRAAAARSRTPRRADTPARSDVDELVEVRHEVLDQPVTPVGDLRSDPRDQRPQRDGRYDQVPLRVLPHRRRWAAAGSEHPFEFVLAQPCRLAEVRYHLDDATALRHVPHQLRCPRVDLGVWLVGEPGA